MPIEENFFLAFLGGFFISVYFVLRFRSFFVWIAQLIALAFLYSQDYTIEKTLGFDSQTLTPVVYQYQLPNWFMIFLAVILVYEIVYLMRNRY